MEKKLAVWIAIIAALARVDAIQAHHSISMFEISVPIWVKGTVVSYEPVNPHAVIVLEETTNDGIARRWLVEGPALHRLERMNVGPDFIQIGDVMEVCGFPPKAEFSSQRPSLDTVGYPPQTFHGHVLLMRDGKMSPWGPYGKLENCIRPDDPVQTWVDFLNTDPMARSYWCFSRGYVRVASLPRKELVDEISSLMANPCE